MKKILFLDESGDHNLTAIDPQHPIFVLGGIIVDEEYAFNEMTQKLNAFKEEIFGTKNIILHTADFTRQKNGFERMKEPDFCQNFYSKLNQLILELDIKIICCAIKKEEHMQKYGIDAIDPYHLSLNILVEEFCFELEKTLSKGKIFAEARDHILNRQLNLAWLNLQTCGTPLKKGPQINNNIDSLTLKTKEDNLAGLEIADAIVTPIARKILNRKSRIDIEIIQQKMRKSHLGKITEYGLFILPK